MNTITGYTGLYGIVANPIKHSFSPMMHNTAFQYLGIDDVYLAFEVKKKTFHNLSQVPEYYLSKVLMYPCLIKLIFCLI